MFCRHKLVWVRCEHLVSTRTTRLRRIRIDECMALASVDLLAGIVAAWSASFCRLHALGIDDCTGRAGLTPRPLTIEHDQGVIDLRETIFITELREPAIDRVHGGKSLGSRRHGQPDRIT